jgi:hypothetical protein
VKKKIIKPSEKFKFNFDWDGAKEDTSKDLNPLYDKPHEVGRCRLTLSKTCVESAYGVNT